MMLMLKEEPTNEVREGRERGEGDGGGKGVRGLTSEDTLGWDPGLQGSPLMKSICRAG